MKKSIFLILTIVILSVCLMGCEVLNESDSNESDSFESKLKQASNDSIRIWIDEETGVQYIIYGESWGYSGGAGITPRLNADGTLYITTGNGGDTNE